MVEFLKFGLGGFWFAVFVFASVLALILYKDHQERLARLREEEEKAILEMEEQNFSYKIKSTALDVNREVFSWHRKCDNFVNGNISTFRLINFAITNARGFDYNHCINEIEMHDREHRRYAFHQQQRYWDGMQQGAGFNQQAGFGFGDAYGGFGNPFGFR